MSDFDYMIDATLDNVRSAARGYLEEPTLEHRLSWQHWRKQLDDLLEMEIDPPHCRRCKRALTPDLIAGREGSLVWCEPCMEAARQIAQEDPSPAERRQMQINAARERQERGA